MHDRSMWTRRAVTGSLAVAGFGALPLASAAARSWGRTALDAVVAGAKRNSVAALIVAHRGATVLSEGEVARPFALHSMRKSVLSALFGIAWDAGEVDLDATLERLGIDDDAGLTPAERGARVRDLLEARSGVYIPASAEAPRMRELRPARGSHAPGSFWYYNNWDFNALGDVYQRLTGTGVFTAFEHRLARPLGFQDFDVLRHSRYQYEPASPRFPAYHFLLSARDLLRIGQLYLDRGRWKGRRLLSERWIADSTRRVSATNYVGALAGYGWLWWVAGEPADARGLPAGAFTAAGAGGHYLTVVPSRELVVVVRVNTFDPDIRSPLQSPAAYTAFLGEILAAHPDTPGAGAGARR